MVLGKEVGEQGTPHLQCMVVFTKRRRTEEVRKLLPKRCAEIKWVYSNDFSAAKYCREDGDFAEFGERPREPKKKAQGGSKGDDTYKSAFEAPTVREGMSIVRAARPRDAAIHGIAIERNLNAARAPVFVPKYSSGDFLVAPLDLSKSVLVWGPSGLGKTQFVLSHFKNPLVITHMDGLRSLSPDHDAIVFDDMSFSHYPPEAVIHLLDIELPRDIHIRYGVATIPANTVKIFTHNSFNPFYKIEIPSEQQEAIERRFKRFNVTKRLY